MSRIEINIGGKIRGWKANQLTVELFSKFVKQDGIEITSLYAAVYSGLMADLYVNRAEPDFTFADVCDWVDAIYEGKDLSIISAVNDAFEDSAAYISTMEKLQDKIRTEVKPKAIKKKVTKKRT